MQEHFTLKWFIEYAISDVAYDFVHLCLMWKVRVRIYYQQHDVCVL